MNANFFKLPTLRRRAFNRDLLTKSFYRDLLTKSIKEDQSATNDLIENITMEEIISIVFMMDKDKASGLDGFSTRFFQYFYNIIGNGIGKVVQ